MHERNRDLSPPSRRRGGDVCRSNHFFVFESWESASYPDVTTGWIFLWSFTIPFLTVLLCVLTLCHTLSMATQCRRHDHNERKAGVCARFSVEDRRVQRGGAMREWVVSGGWMRNRYEKSGGGEHREGE
ncbi:hypothetical protein IE53DRAFT_63714 [Violaceomyces palustris]|uniref:Uncharacterized protein n=1 Tax=Violaceomyces palustris TaxID=1673888 RepID=A0ACD0NZ51_9BASI|nr:hypothetical protein IE53DRAFT_63714 [Violaceomyces palustris]